jgi:DNA-binding Xre family transcriptional regulator
LERLRGNLVSELSKAPRPKSTEFVSVVGKKQKRKKELNLDDVFRGIILEVKEAHDLSTRALAKKMGVRQQTLSTFLTPGETQGCRLALVSRLCASLDLSPVELFQIHPVFASDHGDLIARIRSNLSEETWVKFVEIIVVAQALSISEVWIEQAHSLVMSFAESQNHSTKSLVAKARKLA